MSSPTIACLVALLAPALLGAEKNRSWDVLIQSAQIGRSVVVYRMNGGHYEGSLLAIDDSTITLRHKGQPQIVARPDVFRVRYANLRRRNTLLGMAIGTAAGAAILGIATNSPNRSAGAAAGAIFGLGFGALGGGVLPLGAPLYEAERPARARAAQRQP